MRTWTGIDRLNAWLRPTQEKITAVWLALSMRAKLSLLFSGLILLMTALFYAFAIYLTTREIKISAVYKGQAVAEALKNEVSYALQTTNFGGLNNSFRRLSSSRHDIAYVVLTDLEGHVLAHSSAEFIGDVFHDEMTRKALNSLTTVVQYARFIPPGEAEASDICDVSTPILVRGKRAASLRIGLSLTQYLLANGPRIRSQMILFILPFAFLSMLAAIKLSASFTRPLKDLASAVTEVSHGNYNVQLPLNRRDELGEVAHAFNSMSTNLKENFAKVSDMANRDGLTGLYNARFFQEALSRELDRGKRNARPLSLIIFDADRFKRVNDRYGHPMGDLILQHVSRIGRGVLRGYDVLARYGGEEFIAMLTDTTASQAALLAERLRKGVEQRPFVTEEGDAIKVTISIGVAQAKPPYDKKEFITQADQALYHAKETGRNRVIIYKPALPGIPTPEKALVQHEF